MSRLADLFRPGAGKRVRRGPRPRRTGPKPSIGWWEERGSISFRLEPEALFARLDAALEEAEAAATGHLPDDERDAFHLSRDLARHLADSADLLDVVGAVVLAEAAVDLAGGRAPRARCFVHPLHSGRVTSTALSVRPGGTWRLPLCRVCRDHEQHIVVTPDDVAPQHPAFQPLRDADGRPYFHGDTVWAETGYGALDPEPWHLVSLRLR